MYDKHEMNIIGFDKTDVFVDDNTPSNGGYGGWDQFSVDPEKSDI